LPGRGRGAASRKKKPKKPSVCAAVYVLFSSLSILIDEICIKIITCVLLKKQIFFFFFFFFFWLLDGRAIFFKKRFSFKRGHITAAPDVWKKTKDFYFYFFFKICNIFYLSAHFNSHQTTTSLHTILLEASSSSLAIYPTTPQNLKHSSMEHSTAAPKKKRETILVRSCV
jgi:hypothetical protein